MNFPLYIIEQELFPRLELSGMISLSMADPSIKCRVQRYLVDFGKRLDIFGGSFTHRNVLDSLEYKSDIRSNFIQMKIISVSTIILLMKPYIDMYRMENQIMMEMNHMSQIFESDMNNNLDNIFKKKFIKLSSMSYIIDNIPKMGLTNGNIDFRILGRLFPNFERSIETMIKKYIVDVKYQESKNILEEFKTEINQRLYSMLTPFNSNKF